MRKFKVKNKKTYLINTLLNMLRNHNSYTPYSKKRIYKRKFTLI